MNKHVRYFQRDEYFEQEEIEMTPFLEVHLLYFVYSPKLSLNRTFEVNPMNKFPISLQFTLVTHGQVFWCFVETRVDVNITKEIKLWRVWDLNRLIMYKC